MFWGAIFGTANPTAFNCSLSLCRPPSSKQDHHRPSGSPGPGRTTACPPAVLQDPADGSAVGPATCRVRPCTRAGPKLLGDWCQPPLCSHEGLWKQLREEKVLLCYCAHYLHHLKLLQRPLLSPTLTYMQSICNHSALSFII